MFLEKVAAVLIALWQLSLRKLGARFFERFNHCIGIVKPGLSSKLLVHLLSFIVFVWYAFLGTPSSLALKGALPTRMGFEPTRAEHIGLAVQRLNHSATSSLGEVE